jgi:hypothetical protein
MIQHVSMLQAAQNGERSIDLAALKVRRSQIAH